MGETIRVGLIGVGMMGREHLRNLKLIPEAQVVALADPHGASLERGLKTIDGHWRDVAAFETTESMLASADLDAVMIVSPNNAHRQALELVFQRDLHILCEKPLCTTLEDARWAAEQASKRQGVFWTGMEYRFMPPAARFIADIHGGRIGRLRMLSIREHRFPFLVKVGDWNRFSRNTGGTMVEKCCHFFDLMRLVTGAEAVRVYCSGAMDVNHLHERYGGQTPDIIDNSYTVVDFDNEVRAMLDLSMFAEGAVDQEELVAVGDQAKLEAFIPTGDLVFSPRTPLGEPKAPVREHVSVDEAALKAGTHHGATFYQLRAFFDACQGVGPVQVTADDGLRAVAIGAAAELSAREHRAVEMSEFGL